MGPQRLAKLCPIPTHLYCEDFLFFYFLRVVRDLDQVILRGHHLRWVTFASKTAIPRGRQLWAKSDPAFARLYYGGFYLPILARLRDVG